MLLFLPGTPAKYSLYSGNHTGCHSIGADDRQQKASFAARILLQGGIYNRKFYGNRHNAIQKTDGIGRPMLKIFRKSKSRTIVPKKIDQVRSGKGKKIGKRYNTKRFWQLMYFGEIIDGKRLNRNGQNGCPRQNIIRSCFRYPDPG